MQGGLIYGHQAIEADVAELTGCSPRVQDRRLMSKEKAHRGRANPSRSWWRSGSMQFETI